MRTFKLPFCFLVGLLVLMMSSGYARAQTIYNLTANNIASLNGTSIGTVTVTLDTTGPVTSPGGLYETAIIAFSLKDLPPQIEFSGNPGTGNASAAVNVNATSWTPGSSSDWYSIGATGMDGFTTGKDQFNQGWDLYATGADGYTASFTVTNTSGWSSDSSVLTEISAKRPYTVAVHFYDSSLPAGANTGFAADGLYVPEPTTLLLLGLGLMGLAGLGRKFRRS